MSLSDTRDRTDALAARVGSARSMLFVPGDRPTRFGSALASTADLVVVDLEDAVARPHKAEARAHVAELLRTDHPLVVRINPPATAEGRSDLAMLRGVPLAEVAVMVTKCEDESDVASVATALGTGVPVLPLVETARGLCRVDVVARAAGVARLVFGSLDYALDCGCAHERDALLLARSTLVTASRAAGLPGPVEGVTAQLRAPDVLADDTAYARRLGFTGKLCIHPEQTTPVNAGLSPTGEEVAWATEVLRDDDGAAGAVRVGDTMVDEPVRRRARRLLEAAELAAAAPAGPTGRPEQGDLA